MSSGMDLSRRCLNDKRFTAMKQIRNCPPSRLRRKFLGHANRPDFPGTAQHDNRRVQLTTLTGRRIAPVQVVVRDNNVDQALRALKKKMQREGVFREMKLRRNYEKPSERRAREKAEAVRRYRKLLRKRMEREGY